MVIIRRYKSKKILLALIFACIFGVGKVYATSDIEANTVEALKSYENWSELSEEDKENSMMPLMYTVKMSEEDTIAKSIFRNICSNTKALKVGASVLDSSFDLRNKMQIEVKDQGETLSCWAFAAFNSMETNLKLKYGTSPDFSEKHMNYATSQSFYDGRNNEGFNRVVDKGGSSIVAMAYLTNGQGAIFENQMPFENNMDRISLNDIKIEPSYYVKGYETFPSIYKYKNDSDRTICFDGNDHYYTEEEVNTIRNQIKEHIINYGGVMTYTFATDPKFYNDSSIVNATAYYCDDFNGTITDHAVTIIGWDDNYSRDNFTGTSKPNKNGAYLILNSYSKDSFDNGYLWISYEDVWIESNVYGITESSQINYDNLYQNDWYGANIPVTLTSYGNNVNEGYYASIYDRNSSQMNELLTEVSVSTCQTAKLEIYINPNGEDLSNNNLIKVATTDTLKPGYNTIQITPTTLTGDKFAVVVKHITVDDSFYFMVEAEVDNTIYDCITAKPGYSRVSLDGINWVNLGDLGTIQYGDMNIDLNKADVCIKSFTTYTNTASKEYAISNDNYITKVYDNTKINEFLDKISIENGTPIIYNQVGEIVTDYDKYIGTGMILKVNDKEYTVVVRGDLSGDGRISLLDLSKHIAHYTGIPGFILTGAYDKAGDINLDGNLSLIDVSQLLVIFTNM